MSIHIHVYRTRELAEFTHEDDEKSAKEAVDEALKACKEGRVDWVDPDNEFVAVYWEDTIVDSEKPQTLRQSGGEHPFD